MKKGQNIMFVIGLGVLSLLAGGCVSENGPETSGPDPLPVLPDLQTVTFTVTYEGPADTSFHSPGHWKEMRLMLASLDKNGKLLFYHSFSAGPRPQGYPSQFLSQADSVTANFQGKIIRNADSLVAYCYSPGLTGNFAEQYAGRVYQVITAGCNGDTNRIAFTLKHQTARMDLKLTNQTGQTLKLRRMKMFPVDQKLAPFHSYAVNYFSFSPTNYYPTTNINDIYIPEVSVAPGESYTCRFSLFLTDEKVLEGKAINYIIQSEQGTYTYSRVGKTYLRGQRYTDEITIEGT